MFIYFCDAGIAINSELTYAYLQASFYLKSGSMEHMIFLANSSLSSVRIIFHPFGSARTKTKRPVLSGLIPASMATRSTDAPSGLQLKSLTCILSIMFYLRVKSLAEEKKKKNTHARTRTHAHTQHNDLLRVGTQILSNLKQPRSPFSLPHLKGKWG